MNSHIFYQTQSVRIAKPEGGYRNAIVTGHHKSEDILLSVCYGGLEVEDVEVSRISPSGIPDNDPYLVVITYENKSTVTRFENYIDAWEFYDLASLQWSDCYISKIEVGPVDINGPQYSRENGRKKYDIIKSLDS